MQILAFEKALYNIVAGIFTFVAKVYDVMLTLARSGTDAGSISDYPIADVATVMYTIAGVFMLFRVTIAMINMLINPDAVSDSKAGAGKLVTRIITVIVLLLLFVPNGFMFGETGILNRLEQALLAEDGLINNILPNSITGAGGNVPDDMDTEDTTAEANTNTTAMNGVIDNVHAAEVPNTVDCYYFYKEATKTHKEQGQDINDTGHSHIRVNGEKGILHIKFWNYPSDPNSDGNRKALYITKKEYDKYSYTVVTDNTTSYKNYFLERLAETGNSEPVLFGTHYKDGWENTLVENKSGDKVPTCPHIIKFKTIGNDYDAQTGKANSWKTEKSGIVGGWHSEASMKADLQAVEALVVGDDDTSKAVESTLGLQNEKDWRTNALNNDARDGVDPLAGLDNYDEAVKFAQMAMGTFLSCTGSTNCEAYAGQILISPAADKGVVQDLAADPPTMHLDFLPALIAGVGILIWVLVMCVDVIVRRFKLLLLQMIAPIPIISYVDPNDKMFDKWKDMFIATYLDLFIKLIAISFAIYLLQIVGEVGEDLNLILKFFYIVAILVFAKAVPSIISEIFGLKNMGGSFKDITGMAKAAAGFGAGAVLGLGAGAITGGMAFHATKGQGIGNRALAGLSGIGSAFAGTARGAGAGSKGKPLAGAKDISALNMNRRAKYASGLTPTHLLEAATLGRVGMDYASRKDREVEKDIQEKETIDEIPKYLEKPDAVFRKTGFGQTLLSKLQNREIDGDQFKDTYDKYMAWQRAADIVGVDPTDGSKLDGTKLQQMLNNNEITQSQFQDFVDINNDMARSAISLGMNVKSEGALQSVLRQSIDDLNAKAAGSSVVRGAIGTDSVTMYSEFKDAITKSYAASEAKSKSIAQKTYGDPRYNASKGAKTASGDKK